MITHNFLSKKKTVPYSKIRKMACNGNKKVHHEKLAANVAITVSATEMVTTFHAFIYHEIREALRRGNRNKNEK